MNLEQAGYEKLMKQRRACPQWSWCGVLEDEVFPSVDNRGPYSWGNDHFQGLF